MPNDVTLDIPITRIERLLAKVAGMENIDVEDPVTRIERYLKAICDRLDSGGTGELPPITDADDGKVLTADSGLWVAANPSGGRFVVTFSYDESTETWSTDKTFAECVAAWNGGQTLFAYNSATAIYFSMSYYNSEDTYMEFSAVDGESGTTFGFGIDADGVYQFG